MRYNFIEIGTSDFDSLIESDLSGPGLSIEPLKVHLDNLPSRDDVTKINCAVSNKDGEAVIFWIHPLDIQNYNLSWWLKGCSSLYSPHPEMIKELRDKNLIFLLRMSSCPIISWKKLVKTYQIEEVNFLKIDTEGHDCVIVNNVLDSSEFFLPKKITFEANGLAPQEEVDSTVIRLVNKGYKIIKNDGWEVIAEL